MLHIFLVEDDTTLRKGLTELMEREGYQVTAAASGSEARSHADALARADAILLDIMLPDADGIQLCREWRKQGKVTPILFLTALDEEATVVQGLDAGGDDYVTKPFRTQELLGRVRALLRRHPATSYELGDLKVDLDALSVSRGGQSVFLTHTEYRLMAALLRARGRVLTRGQLLQAIWDVDEVFVDENTLSVHISRLRDKLGRSVIVTVRGVGYAWD